MDFNFRTIHLQASPSESDSISEDQSPESTKEAKPIPKTLSVQDMKGRNAIALYDYTGCQLAVFNSRIQRGTKRN